MPDRGAIARDGEIVGSAGTVAPGESLVLDPGVLYPVTPAPLRTLPDAERLVADYLRAHPDITAIVASRVSTELPPNPTFPAVTLTRVGGVPALPDFLDNPRIEVYAWATNKGTARNLAARVQTAMLRIPGIHTLGRITGVVEEGLGPRWDPDIRTDTPRYTLSFELYVHPHP